MKTMTQIVIFFIHGSINCEYTTPSQLALKFNKNACYFSLMHINCRSLASKINSMPFILQESPVHVLAVTETWVTDLMPDTIALPGYQFIHTNRIGGMRGGVGMFIREEFTFHVINQPASVLSDV